MAKGFAFASSIGLTLLAFSFATAQKTLATDPELVVPLEINVPAPVVIPGLSRPPLREVELDLGDSLQLDRPYETSYQPPEGCIEKTSIQAKFCIDPIAWPALLLGDLLHEDIIYSGNQAIVRYDENRVSQAHILFPAERFIQVLEAIEQRFGPPTEQELFKTSIPEQAPVVNTVVRWRSVFKDREDLILEVRAHDDTRRAFPDPTHGFMWLHRAGAIPVFHHLSVVDLMVLRKRRIGRGPYAPQTD